MQSMTGFGKAEGTIKDSLYSVEIKSVNHRYFDVRYRMPNHFAIFETTLTERLKTFFQRGSLEVTVRQKINQNQVSVKGATRYVVDENALESILESTRWLHKIHATEAIPSVDSLLLSNRVIVPIEAAPEVEEIKGEFLALVEKASGELKKMRLAEGKRNYESLIGLLKGLETTLATIPKHFKEQNAQIKEKFQKRIAQWQISPPLDSQRLEWETALLIEKADITEEMERLSAHIQEFKSLLAKEESQGRKLDFLTQELHREANTIGSKSAFVELTKTTVDLKSWIEKLREQIQNVE